jgi:hypothetical protein
VPTNLKTPLRRYWRRFTSEWEFGVVVLLLVYFFARMAYFAWNLSILIPPDEITHFGRAVAFSKALLIPENSPVTAELGMHHRQPYLYYLLMGKVLLLKPGFIASDVLFLRLINAAINVGTAIYAYRWIRLVTDNRTVHLLFVVMFTNTLMFTAIGGSVTYDNLTNLFGASGIYYLTAFYEKRRPEALAAFFLSLLAGALSKRTYLPLALLLALIVVVREILRARGFPKGMGIAARSLTRRQIPAFAVAGLLLILNIALYGVNYVQHGQLEPRLQDIVGVENAMHNRIFARNYITGEFRRGKISYEDATAKANRITHPGDRADTVRLLARQNTGTKPALVDAVTYFDKWSERMMYGTVSYMGHVVLYREMQAYYLYYAILALAIVGFIRTFNPGDANGHMTAAAFVVLSYILILITQVNYPSYLWTRDIAMGVQGRYLFPVLVPFQGLVAYYALTPFPRQAQIALAWVIAVCFIYGDVPYFAQHVPPHWFATNP